MPNSVGILDQLDPTEAVPRLYVKRKEANFFIETGQVVWIVAGSLARKTPKYKRLTADHIIQKQGEKHKARWAAAPSGNLIPDMPLIRGESGLRGPKVMQLL